MAKPRATLSAKQRIKPLPPEFTRRSYYEMAPLQQVEADTKIGPVARKNYIPTAMMVRCVREWLVAGWGRATDPVIGWVHPDKGALLFKADA